MTRPAISRLLQVLALAALASFVPLVRAEDVPARQAIDAEVRAAWKREKITPAGRSSDTAFVRRIYLDLVGTIPTYEDTQRFFQDKDARKREKLIDKLLADPRFATQQANVWDLVLFGRNPPNGDATRKREGFRKWLSDKFAKNEPYDKWARDLLLAEQPGTQLFYVQHRNQPEEATVAVTRIFLGTQLQCARCHDHPFESWTQRDFYGMVGFFVRLGVVEKTVGRDRQFFIGEKNTGEVLFPGSVKERKPGQKGEPIKPKFLNGPVLEEPPAPKAIKGRELFKPGVVPPKPAFSRKEKLVAWLTAKDNPYFARAVVNRTWAQFLGRGFTHPVDDLSEKHIPSHPELFKALTEQFVARKFDLKWLIREIVNSEAYQLAGEGPTKDALPPWYERARVRPLTAEKSLRRLDQYGDVLRGLGQKIRSDTPIYFLMYFGSPNNGRGEFQGGLSEHLFLNNSDHIRYMIRRHKGNLADTVVRSTEPWEKRVDRMFLSVLNRLPRAEERARFVAFLAPAKKGEVPVEDAIWVLLNTAEFRFNH